METAAAVSACPLCGEKGAKRIFVRKFQERDWWLALCGSCGLHYTDPQPTPDEIRGFYAGDYHSQLRTTGGTEDNFGPKYRRYVDWIGGFVKSGATLDVGCATGLLVKMLKDRGYRAEGMELNADSARWGRENYGIPIHEGMLDSLQDRDGAFDLITLTDVLEHTVSPPAELQTIRRLLNPDGHLMVTFPDISAPASRYLRKLSELTRRSFIWRSCHIPLHTWEFTHATAKRLFEQGGFAIAGFRRSEIPEFAFDKAGLLSMPANLTALPLVSRYWGSQMEFMLAKEKSSVT